MTEVPYGSLSPSSYQVHIRADADALISAVRASEHDARVPSCPEWTVRDLVDHLGVVHQWASLIVSSGTGERPGRDRLSGVGEGDDLTRWYDERVSDLLATLAGTDPEKHCWTHQEGRRVAAYWSRRQAHEVAVHRADAQLAAGLEPGFDAELAVDGIGEVLDVWMPAVASYLESPPDVRARLLIACTDRPEQWVLTPNGDGLPQITGPGPPTAAVDGGAVDAVDAAEAPEAAPADGSAGSSVARTQEESGSAAAVLRGTAADLVLVLWRRLDPGRLVVEGDSTVAAGFLASPLTP